MRDLLIIDIIKYPAAHPSRELIIKKIVKWIETHGTLPKTRDFGKDDLQHVGISFYTFKRAFSNKSVKDIFTEILSVISVNSKPFSFA